METRIVTVSPEILDRNRLRTALLHPVGCKCPAEFFVPNREKPSPYVLISREGWKLLCSSLSED